MSDITKKALAMTLKEILKEKRLNKITVADITEKCGINRQTFYYHFQDIYDLVDWICIHEAEEILNGRPTYDTWQEGFLAIFELVKQDKVFIDNIYHSISLAALEQYLYKVTLPLIKDVVTEKAEPYNVQESDIDFIANFYKFAFVGLMLEWIREGMRENPKQIIDKISVLVHGTIDRSLSNYHGR